MMNSAKKWGFPGLALIRSKGGPSGPFATGYHGVIMVRMVLISLCKAQILCAAEL